LENLKNKKVQGHPEIETKYRRGKKKYEAKLQDFTEQVKG
jgi:hypothetical protein